MDRTRIIFVSILLIGVCFVGGLFAVQFLVSQTSDNDTAVDSRNGEGVESSVELPADGVLVTLASSNTKRNWMDQIVADFNTQGVTTSNGRPIVVEV